MDPSLSLKFIDDLFGRIQCSDHNGRKSIIDHFETLKTCVDFYIEHHPSNSSGQIQGDPK